MIALSYLQYFKLSYQKDISKQQYNKLMQKMNIIVNFIKITITQSYYTHSCQSKNYHHQHYFTSKLYHSCRKDHTSLTTSYNKA